MEMPGELATRMKIFDALARVVAEQGVVTREQLSAFPVGDTTRRLIDQSRGIWNPRDLAASLAVVSSPNGPYADVEVEGGCSAMTTAPDRPQVTTLSSARHTSTSYRSSCCERSIRAYTFLCSPCM
jgi:hypothetical protein